MQNMVHINELRRRNTANVSRFHPEVKMELQPCKSPILIERLDKDAFSVAFHKSFFNLECLEIALRGLGYGEGWELYKPKSKQTKMYTVYVVVYQGNLPVNASSGLLSMDDVLDSIAGKITKEVYLEELNLWDSKVSISDLAKPYQYVLGDGANISAKTSSALDAAGFDTVHKLIEKTREEVCKIPGMTTEEVYRLEKSMASRGFFLLEEVPRLA